MKPLLLSCALILVVLLLSASSLSAQESVNVELNNPAPQTKELKAGLPEQKRTSESSAPQTKQNKEASTKETKPAKPQPLSVQIIESDYLNKTSAQDDAYKKESLDLNRKITDFTEKNVEAQNKLSNYTFALVCVAVFQFILFFAQLGFFGYQLYLMRAGVRVSITQAGIANSSLESTRANSQNELRAYVGVERIAVMDGPVHGEIKIRNFGKTMAKDVEVTMAGIFAKAKAPTAFAFGDSQCKTILMPNEAMISEEPIEIGERNYDSLSKGKGTVYVWGRIDYKDVLGEPRWTTFRFMTKGIRTVYAERPGFGWKVKTCKEGNDAS